MGTHKFQDLLDQMTPARRENVEQRFQETLAAMPLDEIRKARELTQMKLGERLGVHQSEVSKIEHRSDICVSTLADYVEALGGKLEIRAVFPDRQVVIRQYSEADR